MTYVAYPPRKSQAGAGGGGLSFPLAAPTTYGASNPAYGFSDGRGGLYAGGSGGIGLAVGGIEALVADAQGGISLAKTLSVQGLSKLTGGLQTSTITAASATLTGSMSVGGTLGVTGDAAISGDLTARAISASAAIQGQSITAQQGISGASLLISGAASFGSLAVSGTFRAGSLQSDGPIYFPVGSTTMPGLALDSDHSTGILGGPNGFLALATAGQIGLQIDGSQVVTVGALKATGITLSGSLSAASAGFSGQVSVGGKLSATSDLEVSGDLTVDGAAYLGTFTIATLNTSGNATVGGTFQVQGETTLSNLTLTGTLSVQGDVTFGNVSCAQLFSSSLDTSRVYSASFRVPTGDVTVAPVLVESPPNGSPVRFAAYISPRGDFGVSGDVTILGDLTASAASLQVASASMPGALSVGGAAQVGGLTSTGAVTSQSQIQAPALLAGSARISSGSGSPTGVVSGSPGDSYADTQNGIAYLKVMGTASTTGWVSLSTSSSSLSFPVQAPYTAGSPAAPAYSFISAGDGLGATAMGQVYLATGGVIGLSVDGSQTVSVAKAFQVSGAASFAGVTATSVSAGSLSTAGNLSVQGNAAVQGTLSAQGLTTLAGLSAQATQVSTLSATSGSFSAAVSAASASLTGGLSAGGSVAAATLLTNGTQVLSGNGPPTGTVSGSPGDLYLDHSGQASASAWYKTSGQATTSGWVAISTSSAGTTFPLTAPEGTLQAPSYGFGSSAKGLTGIASGGIALLTAGTAALSIDASQKVSLAGGLSVAGASALAALSVTSLTASGNSTLAAVSATSLTVSGTSSLATVTASGALSVGQTLTVSRGALITEGLTAGGTVTGSKLVSGTSTWSSAQAPPTAAGQVGDTASDQTTSNPTPFYVYTSAGWSAVQLVGQPQPARFPLQAPANDSPTANSYSWAGFSGVGLNRPGANQLGLATSGVQAILIDAAQGVTLSGTLTGQAASFTTLAASGTLSVSGAATLASGLNVTGTATISGSVSCASVNASGGVSGGSLTTSGALNAGSGTITNDLTVGGNLTVTGTTTYSGVQRAPFYQLGDGALGSPALSFQSDTALGLAKLAPQTLDFVSQGASMLRLAAAKASFSGAVSLAGGSATLTSPSANTLALQVGTTTALSIASTGIASFSFQAQYIAGTAAAPGVAVGGPTGGLFTGTDAASRAFVGLSQGGAAVARVATYSLNSLAAFQLALGDPASASFGGGIIASAQLPATGGAGAMPGMLYQYLGGGPTQSLWVNESTTATPAFAKVLTTSSPGQAPAFPLLATSDGSLTAPTYSWSSETGLGWFRSGAATMTATAAGAPLAALTTNLLTLPGALRVGATNAGLTSPGANQLALQTAGVTALSVAASGITSHAFQAQHIAGTAAAPGVAVGNATHGLHYGTNFFGSAFTGLAQGGLPVAQVYAGTAASTPNWIIQLGNPASSTVAGGIIAGTVTPVGNVSAYPGQMYQWLGGGAAASAWVNESTTGTATWAKVLTTSSPITPTFPMQSTTLGSATSPAYGFSTSGYTTTGIFAAANGADPSLAVTTNGVTAASFLTQTINSLPVYSMFFGSPTLSNGQAGGIRSTPQSPLNVLGAFQGQLCLNAAAGVGTTLWVKESWSSSNSVSGWAYAFTSGMTQIAAGNGTVAAPYYSFSGDKASGLYLGDTPYLVRAGKIAVGFDTNFAGQGYSGITFGAGNTDGNPYMFGVPSTVGSAGNPNTLAIPAARAALMLNAAGAAGNQIWIHEPTASASGWVRVLSENTALSFSRLLQTTAPAGVSGQSLIWAGTDGRVFVTSPATSGASSQPSFAQEIQGTTYGASQNLTANNNNSTICLVSATQFTLTLPASSATIDLRYRFQVENAAGVVIKANAGQLIYYGASVSTAAGTLTSTTVGSTVELFLRAGTNNWYSRGPAGNWTTG